METKIISLASFFFVFLFIGVESENESGSGFVGHELLSINVVNEEDATFLRTVEESTHGLDFWLPVAANRQTTVLVPAGQLAQFKQTLEERRLQFHVINRDIEKLVKAGSAPARNASSRLADVIVDHYRYHSYNQINSYLSQMASKYPGLIKLETLYHTTHDQRQVTAVKLSGSSATTNTPVIVLEAGIHAREWISPAATLYFIEKLLRDYSAGNSQAQKMLNDYTWHIIPVTNPDGYEYSRQSSNTRLWRKNRRPISFWCSGVDLNRNFDSQFGTIGVSQYCNSDIYPGEYAFSEPETMNIHDLVLTVGGSMAAYVSVHSYSQLLLVPWSHETNSNNRPANYRELDRVGRRMTESISDLYGTHYEYGTAYQVLNYAAAGGSKDWALLTYPNIYAFTYELQPDAGDSRGFILPPDYIVPQGEELYGSLLTMVNEMQPQK